MSEYIKKDDILSAAVEVEYLGRRRMMVSVSKVDELPVIEIVRCKDCKWNEECRYIELGDDDCCSRGEIRDE